MKRSHWWPIGITAVLLATVSANFGLLYVAGHDPSLSIEPNYYAKAIAWDSTMAQRTTNARLGWLVVPHLSAFAPDSGAALSVTVSDSTGVPIADATVTVSALYNGRASVVLESTLHQDGGAYRTTLPISHRGQWELRFDVRHGTERFTNTMRVEAAARSGPAS
jgi:hypothetical protein